MARRRRQSGKGSSKTGPSRKAETLWALLGLCAFASIGGVFWMVQAWGWRGFLMRVLTVLGIALALGLAWKFRRGLWALTKAGLRAGFLAIGRLVRGKKPPPEHPLAPRLRTLVPECTDPQGRTLIPLSRLAELLEDGPRERLTPTQSVRLCETIEQAGYCVEPDARLTGKSYRGDETVTAFTKKGDEQTSPQRYKSASLFLRMGVAVAAADGQADERELATIMEQVEALFDLNEHERRRAGALAMLLVTSGNDTAGLARLVRGLDDDRKQAVAKLLLAVAAADGVVTKEEIRALRKLHKTLGFDKGEIDRALESLRHLGEAPVKVQPATAGPEGEVIPAAPGEAEEEEREFRLDRSAIAAIMADTREVARMLADAMAADEEPVAGPEWQTRWAGPAVLEAQSPAAQPALAAAEESPPANEPPVAPPPAQVAPAAVAAPAPDTPPARDGLPPVPPRYAALYHLLVARKQWPTREAADLAREQGLMLNAALDALNEWAADACGGQLFYEEDECIMIEQEYLN